TCPTASSCFCKEYYYGSRCQFTTTGFGLSLDDIFGYDILPNVSFSRQPTVVKITTAFTIIILVLAIINGTLCITTFQTKRSLAIGTGFYLLLASITSLLTIILFALKFLFLLLSQISIVTIYHFLRSNCLFTNMLLTAFFAIEEWLNSCVSIERVLTVKLGIEFDKTKIIIAIPRLIISFGSECMKSVQSPWLYLSGYFIPFMPPLLVFIIFVLPSEFYRKEFNEATLRIKKVLQSQFRRD
ncbi:unnamed protein product, partial [Rotaria socialis]